jgi:hypothetical protein
MSTRSRILFFVTAWLIVLMPFLFWWNTWFGRHLSDRQLGQYLQDTQKPRHIQHALVQIGDGMAQHDPAMKKYYPELVQLAGFPAEEIRNTDAWAMGQDSSVPAFHRALLQMLNDASPTVRGNAALALVRFGDDAGRPQILALLQPMQSSGSTWMRPNGGWSSSGTQNMQSSTGQYSTHAGEPAQPVQHSVITASSFGFFLRGVSSPLERGSNFISSGTTPGARCVASGAICGAIIPQFPPGEALPPACRLTTDLPLARGAVLAQRRLNVVGPQLLAVVHPFEQAVDDFLGFVFAEVPDKSVIEVLASHRLVDFVLFVGLGELGVIDHAVLPRVGAIPVNLEHCLVSFHRLSQKLASTS